MSLDERTDLDAIPGTVAAIRHTFQSGRTRPVEWRQRQLDGLLRILDEHGLNRRKSDDVSIAARETGIPVRTLDPAVSGSEDPRSYIAAMDANLAVLREALGRK